MDEENIISNIGYKIPRDFKFSDECGDEYMSSYIKLIDSFPPKLKINLFLALLINEKLSKENYILLNKLLSYTIEIPEINKESLKDIMNIVTSDGSRLYDFYFIVSNPLIGLEIYDMIIKNTFSIKDLEIISQKYNITFTVLMNLINRLKVLVLIMVGNKEKYSNWIKIENEIKNVLKTIFKNPLAIKTTIFKLKDILYFLDSESSQEILSCIIENKNFKLDIFDNTSILKKYISPETFEIIIKRKDFNLNIFKEIILYNARKNKINQYTFIAQKTPFFEMFLSDLYNEIKQNNDLKLFEKLYLIEKSILYNRIENQSIDSEIPALSYEEELRLLHQKYIDYFDGFSKESAFTKIFECDRDLESSDNNLNPNKAKTLINRNWGRNII